MIDLNRVREQKEEVKSLILKKEPGFEFDRLVSLDTKLRELRVVVEDLRKDRNELAKHGAKGIIDEIREKSIELGRKIKDQEKELEVVETEFKTLALSCPNIPYTDVPEGNKESNVAVEVIGDKPVFDFEPKNHLELNEKLKWFDFEVATQMAGSNFAFYRGDAVKMVYALTRLMLKNNVQHGFEPVLPPYLVTAESLENSGNLPKFKGDFYEMPEDNLCLIPTAEVNLTNMYVKKIFDADALPVRHTAWTSCFRREAGGYGSNERGLIRIHQFEKVEVYSFSKPEDSDKELNHMIGCAKSFLNELGLHYRTSLLAAQDCSFCSAKTFDIEVWLPGQDRYYEVSSASNCTDFQSRRAGIRYRAKADAKPELVHTLNASSLALPRLMVALIEQGQDKDGNVILPKILQDEMDRLW